VSVKALFLIYICDYDIFIGYITSLLIMKQLSLEQILSQISDTDFIWGLFTWRNIDLSIEYVSDFQNAKYLRKFVDEICKRIQMNPKWRTRLVLIIDELNNNAIEYGSKKGDINTLELHISSLQKNYFEINVCVSDSGTWEKTKTAHDMEEMKEQMKNKDFSTHDSIRGRGLFLIISHLVDTLYFKDNHSKWLTVGFQKVLDLSK